MVRDRGQGALERTCVVWRQADRCGHELTVAVATCTGSSQSTLHSGVGEGLLSIHSPSWGPMGIPWLLGEGEPVFLKDTAPHRLSTLQWIAPTHEYIGCQDWIPWA